MNELFGWLVQTVAQEKTKKLGISISEKILLKLTRLRAVMNELTHENARLQGELKGKDDNHRASLTCFIDKVDTKNAEVYNLKKEIEALKNTRPVTSQVTVPKPTYSAKVASTSKAPVVTAPKPKKVSEKEQLDRSRKVKATTRFMVEIPDAATVTSTKSGIWETVKTKLRNPRAKTIVSGKALIIIPDDAKTFEVMKSLDNIREISPRKPRVIIYDVDSGITQEELAECLTSQNPELGLTTEDVGCMIPRHKLGPRDGDVVHWVIEAPPNVLAKIENKSVFIDMTRC